MDLSYYFRLQYRLLNRWWREVGLPPWLGHLVVIGAFGLGSIGLYRETEQASWIYVIFGGTALFRAADFRRNQFLRGVFPRRRYYYVRTLENGGIMLPFLIFMGIEGAWPFAGMLLLGGLLLAVWPLGPMRRIRIPSPFYRYPFEFSLGFRRSYGVFILAAFLVFMAIWVDNYNLGVFALVLILLTCLSYYGQPEPVYFVWMHARSSRDFLRHKIGVSWVYLWLALFLFTLPLVGFYPGGWLIPAVLPLAGMAALVAVILAKYAAYPRPMNLAQGVLLALGLSFPPLLLFVIPYFYKKAVRSLDIYLA